ncbi:MAG: hypothetical protein AAGC92_05795 [Pseudomonadota bacterium]
MISVVAVAQRGRLEAEAILMLAALRVLEPQRSYPIVLCVPSQSRVWPDGRGLSLRGASFLQAAGAEIHRFAPQIFGTGYPQGNKIEALASLPPDRPFLFLDTDTLPLAPLGGLSLDVGRPAASLRREASWPRLLAGGPDREAIWRALYNRFGLDLDAASDPTRAKDDWQRFPYYNAGWFYGPCPHRFGTLFAEIARAIRDDPPPELVGQSLTPWLDQIALPLVVHALGGGPWAVPVGTLDGRATLHYRLLALLYATAHDDTVGFLERIAKEDDVAPLLSRYTPFRRYLYEGWGARVRALFDRSALPGEERSIRRTIRKAGLWCR